MAGKSVDDRVYEFYCELFARMFLAPVEGEFADSRRRRKVERDLDALADAITTKATTNRVPLIETGGVE